MPSSPWDDVRVRIQDLRRWAQCPGSRRLLLFLAGLSVAYAVPLVRWVVYGWTTPDASHTLLVPAICMYLSGVSRSGGTIQQGGLAGGVFWALAGIGCVGAGWWHRGVPLEVNNVALCWMMAGYVCGVLAGICWFLGVGAWRRHLFAALFLFVMVPVPTAVIHLFSQWLQLWSADAAAVLFRLTGTPLFRIGQTLQLPGITLRVAEECSGVRSTLVLLITALIAGRLLFQRRWSRAVLFLVVIPIGILRNGVRILTIGLLCVHVDPSMVHHWIHRRGGPIFFVLSLIPLFLIAKGLQRLERGREIGDGPAAPKLLSEGGRWSEDRRSQFVDREQ